MQNCKIRFGNYGKRLVKGLALNHKRKILQVQNYDTSLDYRNIVFFLNLFLFYYFISVTPLYPSHVLNLANQTFYSAMTLFFLRLNGFLIFLRGDFGVKLFLFFFSFLLGVLGECG